MGVHYFTKEQIKELKKNPYVKNVSEKGITYEEGFKEHFMNEYESGKLPSQIFSEAGFDVKALGKKRIFSFSSRVRKQAKRDSGFEDQRKHFSGRPRTRQLNDKEKIAQLKLQVKSQQSEIDFLKRVRYINKKAIAKQSLQSKKNTNSSKEQ